ncbi:hypothetical protein BDW69DRAFT_155876 [Aspergillus filifer]
MTRAEIPPSPGVVKRYRRVGAGQLHVSFSCLSSDATLPHTDGISSLCFGAYRPNWYSCIDI